MKKNKEQIAEDEYRCDNCGEVFKKGWSEEEAEKEAIENFGKIPQDSAIVCDDCYKKIMQVFNN